ncbi:MAG: hypothetical protein V3T23_13340 [Nitrososphaerales archaeon]
MLPEKKETRFGSITKQREKITQLVEAMKTLPQTECPVVHRFAPGCYLREIFMPKDTYVIGKIHATEHFNILLKGEVTVITADSHERYKAPHTFVSEAGVQKVVYMHEDCMWQTLHVTDKTDLKEIEEDVIVESYDQLEIDGLLDKAKRLI